MSTTTGGGILQWPVNIVRFGLPYRQIHAPVCADCPRGAQFRVRFGKPARIPDSDRTYQKSRDLCDLHYRAWRRRHGLPFNRIGEQPTTVPTLDLAHVT